MSGIGHNSGTAFAEGLLKSLVQRIEKLEEEKKELSRDIREIYMEAKSQGFDTKILRKTIALRKMDANERAEQDALIDLYLNALGMLD